MSERAKTVREWIRRENAGTAELGETFREGEGDTYYTLRDGRANHILDALIGCQGCVVYTEEDVAMAATVACDAFNLVCDGNRDGTLDGDCAWRAAVRAAITAAGGVVADEVVEGCEFFEAGEEARAMVPSRTIAILEEAGKEDSERAVISARAGSRCASGPLRHRDSSRSGCRTVHGAPVAPLLSRSSHRLSERLETSGVPCFQ